MNGPLQKISSHYLLTPLGLLPRRVVTVDRSGTVTDISAPEQIDREAGVRFYSGVLIPGFVNAHCHLELSHLRGAIPPGGGFTAFAKGMRACRERFTAQERIAAADFQNAVMWNEGVSAAGDVCNGTETFGIKRRSPIRYHNFAELFGLEADPDAAETVRGAAIAAGLSATVTPHSTYSLNRAPFAAAVGGDENRPLSIHFMESAAENELFRGRGALREWYDSEGRRTDFTGYGSPAERLVAQIPPQRPVMLVHNCLVTQRDIDIVMGHFTAPVTWVLCPGSNRYISGSEPPVGLLRRNGLRIALGTDSLASNQTLSMVRELGMFDTVPLEELIRWATLNGAKALGLDGELGSVEIGKSPGLVLLSGIDMDTMTLTPAAKAERIV